MRLLFLLKKKHRIIFFWIKKGVKNCVGSATIHQSSILQNGLHSRAIKFNHNSL